MQVRVPTLRVASNENRGKGTRKGQIFGLLGLFRSSERLSSAAIRTFESGLRVDVGRDASRENTVHVYIH